MRILYFSNISFAKNKHGYNGGGWIGSFIDSITQHSNIQVGVCFLGKTDDSWEEKGISYFQVKSYKKGVSINCILHYLKLIYGNYRSLERSSWSYFENKFKFVTEEFNPDVIHIFGSEQYFGLVANTTSIPSVLHLQGLLNPCKNALLPPSVSWNSFCIWWNPVSWIRSRYIKRIWEMQCIREQEIMTRVENFIGRTSWDRQIVHCFHQDANYYYGSEILRDYFYHPHNRVFPSRFIIISTISNATYKGLDMVLKSAYVLKNNLKMDFEWKVMGDIEPSIIESLIGINHKDVNVDLIGVVDSQTLGKELLSATCYMHPSYIDNSPNSVCEAQILGVPVVACNVGGVSSLIEDGETGFLIPSNDPYLAACYMQKLYLEPDLNSQVGVKSKEVASTRHNRTKIIDDIFDLYNQIVKC